MLFIKKKFISLHNSDTTFTDITFLLVIPPISLWFCHGVTVNKINSVKYANLFLKGDITSSFTIIVVMVKLAEKQQAMDTMKNMI